MKPKDVLDAAATWLTEEKAKTSGPHEATFLMIARLWAAYPSDDNFVDMAGYAGLAADLQEGAFLGNPSAAVVDLTAGDHEKVHEWIMGRCCCKGGE